MSATTQTLSQINQCQKTERKYYIDWIRIISILGLIVTHSATLFTSDTLSAVNGGYNPVLAGIIQFLIGWRLSLLFVVSGLGTFLALGFRTGPQFARERVRRILIPLIVGTFLISPVQIYLGLLRVPRYNHSYLEYYKISLIGLFTRGSFGVPRESIHWAHLWYLAYLFIFSLTLLPLFLYLKTPRGQKIVTAIASILSKRWAIFLPVVPLIIADLILRPRWPGGFTFVNDLANVARFSILFIYGYLILFDERIGKAIDRYGKVSLIFAAICSSIYVTLYFSHNLPRRGYNLPFLLLAAVRSANAWFGVVGFLSLGRKYLNFKNKLLPYATEAVYPVYVLHMPITSLIALKVVYWPIYTGFQFLIISIGTIGCSLIIIELLIKQTNITRMLFGLKPKPQESKVLKESTYQTVSE